MHTETQTFLLGKTLRVKAEVLKAQAHEFEDTDERYTHQSIAGIVEVAYDDNVGNGEPNWVVLEWNLDVGALIKEIERLKGQVQSLKMHNGKLKRKVESMGLVNPEE